MLRLLVLVGFLVIWEALAGTQMINPLFFSSPTAVWNRLLEWIQDGSIAGNILTTLTEAGLGFVIAAVAGISIGLLLGRFKLLEEVVRPYLDVINSIPRFALAPLFLLWFGLGVQMKVALVVSVVVMPFLINTYSGIVTVDVDLTRMVQNLGASRLEVIRLVTVPWTIPWIVAASRLGIAYALAAAVVGEIVAGNSGLGYLVAYAAGVFDTAGGFAALFVLGLIGYVATTALAILERRLFRWRDTEEMLAKV